MLYVVLMQLLTKTVGPDGAYSPHFLKNCYLDLCHPLFLLFRCVSTKAMILHSVYKTAITYTCL